MKILKWFYKIFFQKNCRYFYYWSVIIYPLKNSSLRPLCKRHFGKLTGKEKRAIAVNGQIPMPTLVFTEGDTAEIYVHNLLKEETSLHWHGLFLPNKEDGVPNLTQMPIKPNTTHVYVFQLFKMVHIGITAIRVCKNK
jgi:hypothetical protein